MSKKKKPSSPKEPYFQRENEVIEDDVSLSDAFQEDKDFPLQAIEILGIYLEEEDEVTRRSRVLRIDPFTGETTVFLQRPSWISEDESE